MCFISDNKIEELYFIYLFLAVRDSKPTIMALRLWEIEIHITKFRFMICFQKRNSS
jgi:hypothetical protein